MNKQPIAWLLAASMSVMQAAPAAAVIASAEQSAETIVSVGNAAGKPGETVSVRLSLKGNRGLNAMAVWLKYDPDVLEPVSISDKGKFGADAFDAPKELSKSPVRLGWTNSQKANTSDGTVAVIEFRIKDTAAAGEYDVEVYTREGENFIADFTSDDPFTDVELAFDGGKITVAEDTEALTDTSAYADKAPAPDITDVSVSGFRIKLPAGYEYTYSETKTDDFKGFKWYKSKSAKELKPNTTYYVYQRKSGDKNVSAPAEIITSKYDISDVIESVSIGTNGGEGAVLSPVITYREGFDAKTAGEFTYCWSAKDWAEPSVALAESYTVTAEDIALGREMQVTVAALNCKGLVKSNPLKAGRSDHSGEVRSPSVSQITADGFVLAAEAGYEYIVSEDGTIPENAVWTSLDGGAAVTGKAAGKTYYVFARAAETASVNASEPSSPVSVKIPGNDASLTKLTVSSGKLTPEFSPEITDYTVYVPYGRSIPRIRTVTASGLSTSDVEQAKGFADGKNTAVIKVTAENGVDTKLYSVTFVRQEELDTPAADTSAEETTETSPADTEEAVPVSLPEMPVIASNGTIEPCVAGDPEKSGWNAVCSEIAASEEGKTVTVKMNDTTELPKEVTECIQNRNVDLVLKMENGLTWTINGNDVTAPKTVNMEVSTSPRKSIADMADSLGSEKKAVPIKLSSGGEFGFTASLTIGLNDRYNGYYSSLYGKDRAGDPEYCTSNTAENGKISLEFTGIDKTTEYAVIFTREPVVEDVSSGAGAADFSVPFDAGMPDASIPGIPQAYPPAVLKRSGKKRRYRIVRRRRLDDMVFVY